MSIFKKIIFILASAAAVFLIYRGFVLREKTSVTDFTTCAARGYPIMESYPRQCRTPDGYTFTENIGNELEKSDLIRLSAPRPNEEIASPLTITGEARGNWFFEASFPVRLKDANGVEIAVTPATAESDWMTTDFVPFSATLTFLTPTTDTGMLELHKDNPSGLPEYDDALIIPIRFRLP